ncbi:MAG: site-specific integrase, partial [Gammaproteobacteria bacterium]
MTFGYYPLMSVAQAHEAHAKARSQLEQGEDPGNTLKTTRQAERQALTVAVLVETYIEHYAKPNKRSWKKDAYMLKKDILPHWSSLKAKTITRRDVNALLDKIVERGATIHTNRVFAVIHKMFNYAISRGELTVNPCAGIAKPFAERQRDRVFSEAELCDFWQGLDSAAMTDGVKLALKLILLTAQRKGEVIKARWENIDLETCWWHIPASITKNKQSHRVYLSPAAMSILTEAKNLSAQSEWVFPSPRSGQSLGDTALNHALVRNLKHLKIEDATVHDLRRTAASHMTAIQIPRLVVSKILNHAEHSVTAIYDRYSYDEEKQKALTQWAEKLTALVA